MLNLMAAQPNIVGALCKSSVIPFLVPCCKVWLECRAVTLPIHENARLGRKVNFARGEIPSGDKSPRKCIHSVAAQETAKHRAQFGWPPLNDVAAVTKPRRETFESCWGAPNSRTAISAAMGRSSPYYGDMWRRYCCFTSFLRLSIYALVAKIQPDKLVRWCADGHLCVIFASRISSDPRATHFQTCILNSH